MKEHITPKQVVQISKESFYSYFNNLVDRPDYANFHHKKMTVGKMIEILTIQSNNFTIKKENDIYKIFINNNVYSDKELCDCLWKVILVLNKKRP